MAPSRVEMSHGYEQSTAPGYEHLPGTVLPPGRYRVSRADDERLAGLLGGRPAVEPHPIWWFIALLRGLGIDIPGLFALGGCAMEDGPMLGGFSLDLPDQLHHDVEYDVTGLIQSIQRKQGRSGTFDIMRVRVALSSDGAEHASCAARLLLPRRPA